MSTYTLLKDLPDVPAGAEFKLSSDKVSYFLNSNETETKWNTYAYPKAFVEENPKWFSKKIEKPPLGIMPKYLHDQKRLREIIEAIQRYTDAGIDIPSEWIIEEKHLRETTNLNDNHAVLIEKNFDETHECFKKRLFMPTEKDFSEMIAELFKGIHRPTKEKPTVWWQMGYTFKNDGEDLYILTGNNEWKVLTEEEKQLLWPKK